MLKVVQESRRVCCEAPFPHWGGIWGRPQKIFLIFFHVKMMHFGVFCVQFHRPLARMNKISNVVESSIALAAVACSPLGCFIVQSIDIWFNHCNRTNGEAVNKETRQRPDTLESAGSSTRCDPAHFKPW